MALKYEFDASGEYFKIVVSGVMDDFQEAMAFSRASAEANITSQRKLVLVDERNLVHKLTTKEMFELSSFLVEHIRFVNRFAIVTSSRLHMNPELLKSFSSFKNFSMDIFYDIPSAERWLLG